MKKEIVFLSSLVAVAAGAQTFPQGMVTLDSSAADVPIYYLAPGTKAPSEVFVEVLASPAGAGTFTSIDLMSETKNTVFNADMGGANGTAYYFYEGAVNVAGVTPGASADFMVRAWTGAATYADATFKVQSPVITQNTAIFNGPPNTPPENPLGFNTALTIVDTSVVPEPATIALLAIGGAALFFRRRQ